MERFFEFVRRFVRWWQSSVTRPGGGGEISGALLIKALRDFEQQRSSQ